MKEFFYKARDSVTGNVIKGCFKADCKAEVAAYLKQEQYLVISINHNDFISLKQSLLQKINKEKIKTRDLIILCRQLAIMLEAGINIIEAILILQQNSSNKNMQKFLVFTTDKLKEGNTLTDIWRQKANILPAYLLNSLNAAENTGMLPSAFSLSADFLEKLDDERQKIRQICIYPAFLLLILFAVLNIMILFVLPAFADVFQRMKISLPFITQMVFSLGLFIKNNYMVLCVGGLSLGLIIAKCWQKDIVKYEFYKYVLRLPFIGDFMQKLFLLQINRQLEFLIGSGIDIDESFSIMIAGFNNSYLNKLLKSIQYSLRQGFSLYTSFKNTHLNNSVFMELINVGEQTGMLKETLHYNNVFLSKDVDNFIDEFTKFLEPILMIVVGAVVGVFVIAIILPLFEMSSNIGL
ncbi:type II secretion system F family protein [Megamonas hypermegale]|uniref:type II secretion system F family protein n=1 Tax=Megamonas hypermegale TaxID=158847 RepID=UPI00242DD2A4|nr:type II secretion system F family protein [Megamonas hypermegale]